jgi:hypothetical protein
MTDIVDRIDSAATAVEQQGSAPPVSEPNPGLIGLPLIIPGAIGLGATNTGLVDVSAAAVPILVSATAVGLLITTMYNGHDTTDGLLVIQDSTTGEVLSTVRLEGIDHYGGVAVHGDHVWVSGGGQVQLYSLSDIRAAENGSTATAQDSFPVKGSSTVTYHDGQLWTAQFDGDGKDSIYTYDVGDDGSVSSHPSSVLGGEQEMQGIAVNDDYVYVSQSEGRHADHSTLTRIDRVTGERESIEVPSNMAEGIALHGNQLVQTYESGAAQYSDGDEPRSTTTVRDLD